MLYELNLTTSQSAVGIHIIDPSFGAVYGALEQTGSERRTHIGHDEHRDSVFGHADLCGFRRFGFAGIHHCRGGDGSAVGHGRGGLSKT